MPDETLLSAARRLVRDFNIDMGAGGLITPNTQHSAELLEKQMLKAAAQLKEGKDFVITPEQAGYEKGSG